MLKNNNQEVLRRLSRRSMKAERTRNFFAVLAIILTTFMFTSVFSIGVSLIQNLGIMQMRNLGSQSTIWLEKPSKQQMDQIRKMQGLRAMGVQVSAGSRKEASREKRWSCGITIRQNIRRILFRRSAVSMEHIRRSRTRL